MHQVLRRLLRIRLAGRPRPAPIPCPRVMRAQDAEPRPELDAERGECGVDRIGVDRLATAVGRSSDRLAGPTVRGLRALPSPLATRRQPRLVARRHRLVQFEAARLSSIAHVRLPARAADASSSGRTSGRSIAKPRQHRRVAAERGVAALANASITAAAGISSRPKMRWSASHRPARSTTNAASNTASRRPASGSRAPEQRVQRAVDRPDGTGGGALVGSSGARAATGRPAATPRRPALAAARPSRAAQPAA